MRMTLGWLILSVLLLAPGAARAQWGRPGPLRDPYAPGVPPTPGVAGGPATGAAPFRGLAPSPYTPRLTAEPQTHIPGLPPECQPSRPTREIGEADGPAGAPPGDIRPAPLAAPAPVYLDYKMDEVKHLNDIRPTPPAPPPWGFGAVGAVVLAVLRAACGCFRGAPAHDRK
jgi:hypothetical protein